MLERQYLKSASEHHDVSHSAFGQSGDGNFALGGTLADAAVATWTSLLQRTTHSMRLTRCRQLSLANLLHNAGELQLVASRVKLRSVLTNRFLPITALAVSARYISAFLEALRPPFKDPVNTAAVTLGMLPAFPGLLTVILPLWPFKIHAVSGSGRCTKSSMVFQLI